MTVPGDHHRGCSGEFCRVERLHQSIRSHNRPLRRQPRGPTNHYQRTIHHGLHPGTRVGDESLGLVHGERSGCPGRSNRVRHRVLGASFRRGGHGEKLVPVGGGGGVGVVDGNDVAEGHPTGGEGAGFVEHNRVDGLGLFEYLGSADEDAQLGAASGADQKCGRCGQAEGAGAGNDQCGDGCGEGDRDRSAENPPGEEGGDRKPNHNGHKDGGDAVSEALGLGFAGLGFLNEIRQAREFCVGADPGDLHHKTAADVEGGSRDAVVHADLDRHGFAGEHTDIDGGDALADESVAGDLLAGTHHNEVARDQVGHGDAFFPLVLGDAPQHRGVLRAELE